MSGFFHLFVFGQGQLVEGIKTNHSSLSETRTMPMQYNHVRALLQMMMQEKKKRKKREEER